MNEASASPRRWVLAYAVLLLVLSIESAPRIVGDGEEYLAVARYFSAFETPPISVTAHFWFYSLLASPLVWLADASSLDPLAGFTVLNTLLLVGACWVAWQRLGWRVTVLLFVGPIIWWVDKAHTEAFTFSLLILAMTLLRERPHWSLICIGTASLQNPPLALVLPFVGGLALVRRGLFDRHVWIAAALAGALAIVNPGYYLLHLGHPAPLADPGSSLLPNALELRAVLFNLNIGLLPNFPTLAAVIGLGLGALSLRARDRLWNAELAVSAVTAGIFLLSTVQTNNMNHGATRSMSRYALWFIPLAIPLLRTCEDAFGVRARQWLAPAAVISAVWCLVAWRPALPEAHLRPTALAHSVWLRHPAWNNPIPEVFAERLQHRDGEWSAPVATEGCRKVLLMGQPDQGIWPMPCPVTSVPDACASRQSLCYANRRAAGYEFVALPEPSHADRVRFAREAAWPASWSPTVGALLHRARWWELRLTDPGAADGMVRAAHDAAAIVYEGSDRLLVFILEAHRGAHLTLRLPGPMIGEFVDLESGKPLRPARYTGEPSAAWTLPVPEASTALVLHLTG